LSAPVPQSPRLAGILPGPGKSADPHPLTLIHLKNKRQAFVKTLSLPRIQDGLRHTFCTFHYAKNHNTCPEPRRRAEELRRIVGNSPSVIDRFYKGAISQVEVEKFWTIGPTEE
jgi:hypothetical protein